MIEIGLTTALTIYSILLGALAAGLWLYTELSVRPPQRRLGRQFLWKCTFCGCSYLDEQAEKLSQCPRCQSYNAAGEAAVLQIGDTAQTPALITEVPIRNTSRRKRQHQRRRGPRRRR